ncbi:MAG: DNA translocase FtsK 4TM domain-containing protein [Candidatus Lloydbacteria bacterium]|nr:DNA translocase FtsK 4TM domain-containing protein [Candidatus Lloydbacteria bacterium]
MAKKKLENEPKITFLDHLKDETKRVMFAILFFALGLLFMLAYFGSAGPVGYFISTTLNDFIGIGYFLLPILFFLLGVSLLTSKKSDLGKPAIVGSLLFIASGLGLAGMISKQAGGSVGGIIGNLLISFFDVYAAAIILGAVAIISILLIFDTIPPLSLFMFWKRDGSDMENENITITDGAGDIVEPTDETRETVETEDDTNDTQDGDTDDEKADTEVPIILPIQKQSLKKGGKLSFAEYVARNASSYSPPPLSILEYDRGKPGVGDIKANANIIKRSLQNFGITIEMDEISIGPSVTRYAFKPAEGVKLSRIVGLQNDIALALAAHPLRIEAPIPGKSLVGIEIPNSIKTTVGLATLLSAKEFTEKPNPLLFSLGKDISGKAHFADLGKMPHLLVAGTTGSGKSVMIHTLITSLLYRNSPEILKFIMIDPKRVELTLYNSIPHLLTPVVTDPKKAILALKWATKEMERRYDILETEAVRDIDSYHNTVLKPALEKLKNQNPEAVDEVELPETMPYIVIIIDELADIMTSYPRELESSIVRLAQMSRAVGIHLVLSTQRPSVDVITGLIKANIPARIALQVSSQIDSRTILDTSGAEKLLGSGDMLFLSGEMSKPRRLQSAFISEQEVKKVAQYVKQHAHGEAADGINLTTTEQPPASIFDALEDGADGDDDDLYEEAREIVVHAGKASTSYLQRKLKVGYARAARLMDMLEEHGVVGPADGAKAREVLVSRSNDGFGTTEAGDISS